MIDDDRFVRNFDLKGMDKPPTRIVLIEQGVSLRRHELDEGSASSS
jgi:hypothetical protein